MGFEVAGKVALVTGANRGIGLEILKSLLEAGVTKVYAAVRDVKSVQALADESKGRIVPLTLDLTKPETIESAAEQANDVQLVINNAGVLQKVNPLDPKAIDSWRYETEVNVVGLLRMAQAFIPVLRQKTPAAFVQLNSVASLRSFADFASYSASKAASYSFTQALRDLVSEEGIQILSVHPGPIDTDMARDAGLDEMAEPPSKVADGILRSLAAGSFHLFPDTMAESFGQAYESFAKAIVETPVGEG